MATSFIDPYYGDDDTRPKSMRERMLAGEEKGGIGGIRYLPTSARSTQPREVTQTQTGVTTYTGERPAEFVKPEYDEGEIKRIGREIAAPQIRQLRQALQQALVKHYENPNVRRMMVRSALQGYGIGLGGIKAKSRQAARAEYAQKYSFDMQAAMANFQAAWNEYLGTKTTTQVGTTGYQYGYAPEEAAGGLFGTRRRRPSLSRYI